MSSRVYWVENLANGAQLGIMARPRGGEWLESEIVALHNKGVNVLVSLLETAEISELDLREEEQYCMKHGVQFIHFPIPDRGIPAKGERTENHIAALSGQLEKGRNVVIHCRMGIGRSSLVAGAVLLKKGHKTDELLHKIEFSRGLTVPDTEEQVRWLKEREKRR